MARLPGLIVFPPYGGIPLNSGKRFPARRRDKRTSAFSGQRAGSGLEAGQAPDIYFVYILQSVNFPRQYIGSTDTVDVRLKNHNAGSVRSTKAYHPWTIVKIEKFATKKQARQRELQLKKSGRLRKVLKQLVVSKERGTHMASSSNG